MLKKNFPLVFIILTSFLIFSPVVPLYFFQDDFFLLTISRINNIRDFLRFFIPANGVIWYRPLSSQVFFFIGQNLFGLNPFPYHLVMLLTHLLNIYLVFLFTKKLCKNEKIVLVASFIYGVSSVHFITLAWLATYSFILGPTFVLLTLLYYLKKKYKSSLLFFVFGFLTSEVVIWTLIPLTFITAVYQKSRVKLVPFLIAVLAVIFVRNVLFPVRYVEAYSIIINPLNMFSLFKFYLYRTVGIPMLIKSMPNNLFKFIILLLSAIVILIPIISLFHKKTNSKLLLLSLAIYISFLSIFLFLPFHYSPHYLTFSLIGVSLFLGLIISSSARPIQAIFIISYFILQAVTVKLTYDTHWVVKRARLAKKLVQEGNLVHPVGSEKYISLGAGKAAEVFKK
ncbi:MAG: hypothetical protein NC935_05070 [Candidatus Omnitrophica bacterium]|nr:hypothetical protein [Candidatus Omnitrophota bacterium]